MSKYITKDKKIYSFGGIVYYLGVDKNPRFLLLKRHSVRKSIERVAPKGKQEPGERPEKTALREVHEEAGLDQKKLIITGEIGSTTIESMRFEHQIVDKVITFFLMHYTGDPHQLKVIEQEGYLGMYKRATLQEVRSLVYYTNMRSLFETAYGMIIKK